MMKEINTMPVGPCPEHIMSRAVYKQLNKNQREIIRRRQDVSKGLSEKNPLVAVQTDEKTALIMTAAVLTGRTAHVGKMITHRVMTKLLARQCAPDSAALSVMLPEGLDEQDLRLLIQYIDEACAEYDVILTEVSVEVTPAVNQPVVSMTATGHLKCSQIGDRRAEAGQAIVMAGYAGFAAAGQIADLKTEQLYQRYHPDFIDEAKEYLNHLSMKSCFDVIEHFNDAATFECAEGGVFGALWNLARQSNCGFLVELKKILLKQQIVEICDFYDINPYMLDGQGALLVCTHQGEAMRDALTRADLPAEIIGYVRDGRDKCIQNDEELRYLDMPKGNEFLKCLE